MIFFAEDTDNRAFYPEKGKITAAALQQRLDSLAGTNVEFYH